MFIIIYFCQTREGRFAYALLARKIVKLNSNAERVKSFF